MDFITNLKQAYNRANIIVRIIYINAAVFIFFTLLSALFRLFNISITSYASWLSLPASLSQFLWQPWSIITYMFMHGGITHILFNMLWLYWFGHLFLYFFSSKHFINLYLLGGIGGGLLYMIAYNIFPYFHATLPYATLVGASASVLAIVVATAYREPNYSIQLFLFGNIQLKYLALIMIASDLLFLTSPNAGGHIAHLGGALMGFIFAQSLSKGKDITCWLDQCLQKITSVFSLHHNPRRSKGAKMKIHHGGSNTDRQQDYDYNARRKAKSDEIDRILDKLKKSGYDALSTEEKKTLFDASKR